MKEYIKSVTQGFYHVHDIKFASRFAYKSGEKPLWIERSNGSFVIVFAETINLRQALSDWDYCSTLHADESNFGKFDDKFKKQFITMQEAYIECRSAQ